MSKKLKKKLLRILGSLILLLTVFIVSKKLLLPDWLLFSLYLVPYILIGWDIIWKAIRGLLHGQLLDENFLMTIATLGAFALKDFGEASFVMVFYQVGEWFQELAVGRSRKNIAALMDIAPEYVRVSEEGQLIEKDPSELSVGDQFIALPGDKIALDGIILKGSSSLDTSALTGESIPRIIGEGDLVYSGSINLDANLTIEATASYDDSTVAKVLELVENSSSQKSVTENFISRFARYYTPIVVFSALLLALIPSLIWGDYSTWIHRALIFLVVSCPCALVISVPLAFFGGIGGAARSGILIKGSNYLEALTKCTVACFDKTGTLTKGKFSVTDVYTYHCDEEKLWNAAISCESFSTHPIALSIQSEYREKGYSKDLSNCKVTNVPGNGMVAILGCHTYLAGKKTFLEQEKVELPYFDEPMGTSVYVAEDGVFLGAFFLRDTLKEDSAGTISKLKDLGITTVMLSGDSYSIAKPIADALGMNEVYAELLPSDKVDAVKALKEKGKVVYIGDGINDAPVLALSDIGISMGALGSSSAIEASDIVLMDDKPSKVLSAYKCAKSTMRIVKENIVFSLAVKIVILALSAFGITGMGLAVFGDVGVAFIAILNAMRALKKE